MKVEIISDVVLQVGTPDGVESFDLKAGSTVDVRQDVAVVLIENGSARQVAERVVKPKGEKAVRK